MSTPAFELRVKGLVCSGPEAGSYLRRIDFVYHSTLGLRVIENKKRRSRVWGLGWRVQGLGTRVWGWVFGSGV